MYQLGRPIKFFLVVRKILPKVLQVLKYFASPPDLLPCVNCAKSIHVRMSVVVDAVVVSAAAL